MRQRDREATAASIARLTEASGKLKPTDNNDTSEVCTYLKLTIKPP